VIPKSRPKRAVLVALLLLAAYLTLWPVPIQPIAWSPPRAPRLEGRYAPNERLKDVSWIVRGQLLGPEATTIDANGHVLTGTRDGLVMRLDPATGALSRVAATGGRPLALAYDHDGRLLVCDAVKGLLAVEPSGTVRVLATSHAGVPFGFTNSLDLGPDGTVYFTDASSRFSVTQAREDVLEHGGRGRLLAYHPETGTTELLLAGLQFANGVAVSGDANFLVVNETGAYRTTRYWLAGPKRGTSEPFLENLPGLPDNVTWSPARRVFWVALFSPRVAALDVLAGSPFLRKVVLRLPLFVQPQPARVGWALAIDEGGRVVESLQDPSPESFSPVTSVLEHDGVLWLGSLERDALGRIAAPPLRPGR